MDQAQRAERLRADLQQLERLKASSTIFDFEATDQPPDRYVLSFRGKGAGRDPAAQADVSIRELHQVELRLPYSYPDRPPDIRWLTPLVHPNISFSGFVNLAEIGLPWSSALGLDVICERLWDVARLDFVNADKAANYSAKHWLETECPHELPLDRRPLRDKLTANRANVVRYERRGQAVLIAAGQPSGDVLFIDENTPAPPLPPRPDLRRRRASDDEVIYIGPE
jgi:ubiquitin-protein ligase